eukprot:scaffold314728_cov15-Tisochrysis_lutea.AAC.1
MQAAVCAAAGAPAAAQGRDSGTTAAAEAEAPVSEPYRGEPPYITIQRAPAQGVLSIISIQGIDVGPAGFCKLSAATLFGCLKLEENWQH